MKTLILLLTLALSLTALGIESVATHSSDEVANRISMIKKGTHDNMTGSSQKTGYQFGFKDGGNLHLWGFGRLYAYPMSNSSKVTMPYFRFYFDGTKDSEWSYRVRADYSEYYINSLEKAANETDTLSNERHIYFGRAFLTYTPKALKGWSFRIGRILNQQHKYDVFGAGAFYYNREKGPLALDTSHINMVNYHVSEGIQADYKNGAFSFKGAVTYRGSTSNGGEEFLYSGRAGHSASLGKKWGNLSYGLAANITSHNETSQDGYELIPDFMWSIGEWYFMDTVYFRDVYNAHGKFKTSDYPFLLRNYAEIGTNYTLFKQYFAVDMYLESSYYDDVKYSNLGLEGYLYLPGNAMIGGSFTYDNLFNEYGADSGTNDDPLRRISGTILFSKYF